MAYEFSEMEKFMDGIGSDSESNFKMLLYYADLSGDFETEDEWDDICSFAVALDEQFGYSDAFINRYAALIQEEKLAEAFFAMKTDMHDNYIMAALALHKTGLDKSLPFVAANAFNKHTYQGLKDEFAVVKFLVWSGFDINAVEQEGGMTALHYFASTKQMPGSHPRAVKWLLEHGADVDAENGNGDTALTYLCAVAGWGRPHSESFVALVNAGSNPFKPSNDGATPYSLLFDLNAKEPVADRTHLIGMLGKLKAEMERDELEASVQPRPARRMAL